MSVDDIILWQSFTEGNRDSFEAIYRRHFDMLYEYGIRQTGDEALIMDTIQDLFVKLWTNRAQLRGTDNIKFYLLTAFKNTLSNVRVRQQRQKEQPAADPEQFLLHFPSFPDPAVANEEELARRQAQLLEALNQLSARQKEIIWLRYFEEMDYEQIASLLDISIGGVYKLHYRALDGLKDILGLSFKDLLLLLILAGKQCIIH